MDVGQQSKNLETDNTMVYCLIDDKIIKVISLNIC